MAGHKIAYFKPLAPERETVNTLAATVALTDIDWWLSHDYIRTREGKRFVVWITSVLLFWY